MLVRSDATDNRPHGEQVEEIRRGSLAWYGIPYAEAERNVQETLVADGQEPAPELRVEAYASRVSAMLMTSSASILAAMNCSAFSRSPSSFPRAEIPAKFQKWVT